MLSKPLTSSHARRLSIRRFKLDASRGGSVGAFAPMIETFSNLEALVLLGSSFRFGGMETEDTKTDGDFARLFVGNSILLPREHRILQNLTSCTLRFSDGNGVIDRLLWDEVFLSASIKRLTLVGCFLFDDNGMVCCEHKFSTPLEELVLENCNNNVRALTRILGAPRALRTLKMEQSPWTRNHRFWGIWRNSMPQSDQEWKDALRQQKHSLETITFIDQTWHRGRERPVWCKEYFDGFDVLKPPYPWDTLS